MVKLRFAIFSALSAMPCVADTVYDRLKVELYRPSWHVKSTLDGFTDKIDIAIDDNVYNGWTALDHGSMGVCYLAGVASNETINVQTFARKICEVEFFNQSDFIVAFAIGCDVGEAADGYFGWFRAAYEGGEIILKGSALDTGRGGSFVAAMPMLDYFHLIGTSNFGNDIESEFEIPLVGGYDGFSEYKTGNGLFTLSYGETDAQFLYLRIGWPKE